MKITIFTGNQPRHLSLIKGLSALADQTVAICEVNTVFPGKLADFHKQSAVMDQYFGYVLEAEKKAFGELSLLPSIDGLLAVKHNDLSMLSQDQLNGALDSDLYIVFGSSYIKGWLADFLIKKNAINIHMGLSPYYKGNACNFWALYDDKPNYVGATIHLLSEGLDSGDVLFHCVAKPKKGQSNFDFTMGAVEAAHQGLYQSINDKTIFTLEGIPQEKSAQIRYSKNSDFTDEAALKFFDKPNLTSLMRQSYPELVKPFFLE